MACAGSAARRDSDAFGRDLGRCVQAPGAVEVRRAALHFEGRRHDHCERSWHPPQRDPLGRRHGAAGGPIRDPDRGSLWYAGGRVSFLTGTVRQQRSESAAARPRDVGFIPATAMAIAPAAWRELGGFDLPQFTAGVIRRAWEQKQQGSIMPLRGI